MSKDTWDNRDMFESNHKTGMSPNISTTKSAWQNKI